MNFLATASILGSRHLNEEPLLLAFLANPNTWLTLTLAFLANPNPNI
jgi:hypothetical protein